MAITQAMCTSFKAEILRGYHALSTTVVRAGITPDTFKIALYTSTATLNADTTAYTTSNEVAGGNGYTTGGETLSLYGVGSDGSPYYTAYTTFSDVTWSNASFTAAGALIYNSSQGDRAVAVLSFGADKTASSGNFTIRFPAYGSTTAILRIA